MHEVKAMRYPGDGQKAVEEDEEERRERVPEGCMQSFSAGYFGTAEIDFEVRLRAF